MSAEGAEVNIARVVPISGTLVREATERVNEEIPPGAYSRFSHPGCVHWPAGMRGSKNDRPEPGGENVLLNTLVFAYDTHRGIHLSPRDLHTALLTIVSGVVQCDPERFREVLVKHEGKREILVTTMGEAREDLEAALEEFAASVCISPFSRGVAAADYPGATRLDRLEAAAWSMDTLKAYYNYSMATMCGFPFAVVHGGPGDWASIAAKVDAAAELFGGAAPSLSDYLAEHFRPVVAMLGRIASGDVSDAEAAEWFGRAFTAEEHFGSGHEATYDGWMVGLFPRIYATKGDIRVRFNVGLESVRPALTTVPIRWRQIAGEVHFVLVAGVHGVFAHPDGSLEAVHGYRMQDLLAVLPKETERKTCVWYST